MLLKDWTKKSQLVAGLVHEPHGKVSLGNALGPCGQSLDRGAEFPGQAKAEPGRAEKDEHGHEAKDHVEGHLQGDT
jgi:hypothetical protein